MDEIEIGEVLVPSGSSDSAVISESWDGKTSFRRKTRL